MNKTFCDICGKEDPRYKRITIPMLNASDQSEKLNNYLVDICGKCYKKAVRIQRDLFKYKISEEYEI